MNAAKRHPNKTTKMNSVFVEAIGNVVETQQTLGVGMRGVVSAHGKP